MNTDLILGLLPIYIGSYLVVVAGYIHAMAKEQMTAKKFIFGLVATLTPMLNSMLAMLLLIELGNYLAWKYFLRDLQKPGSHR